MEKESAELKVRDIRAMNDWELRETTRPHNKECECGFCAEDCRRYVAWRVARGLEPDPCCGDTYKTCNACGKTKPRSDFYKNTTSRDGLRGRCKNCYKDHQRDGVRNYYRSNPEARERARLRYQDNREARIAQSLRWQRDNPERCLAAKARRRSRTKEGMDAFDRALSADYRLAISNDGCALCDTRTGPFHVDHFLPLAKGGTDHWWNLQRLCQHHNLGKSDKGPREWIFWVLDRVASGEVGYQLDDK